MFGFGKKILFLLCFSALFSNSFAWKKEVHMLTLFPIDACGVYSSIRVLQDSRSWAANIPAAMSLSLLGSNAAIGCYAIFGPQPNYPRLRQIHRYVGFAISVTALWMSIAAGNNENISNSDRNIAHAYTLCTMIPVIVLSF
jgi:hypothetical protein